MKIFGYTPAQVSKFLTAVVGFVLTVLAAFLQGNLIPEGWLPYVLIVIGVCASYGVFAKPNAPHIKPGTGRRIDRTQPIE